MVTCLKLLLLLLSVTLVSALQRQSLNGQWTATGDDAGITIPDATVPGGIFSDLMNHGDIDDVFYGTGDANYSWVGLSDWTYTTTVTVDEDLLAHRIVFIVFEGLDTFATILVNGEEVGTSQNMFVRYKINIKDQLKVGDNEVSVKFSSSVNVAAALAADPSNPYVIPPECPDGAAKGICHANRIRKMQAAFSWDWGPAFASTGIWKEVYLEAFNSAVIDYIVATTERDIENDAWNITANVYLNGGDPDGAVSGSIIAEVVFPNETRTVSVKVEPSLTKEFKITIGVMWQLPADIINTWWPNGYGTQDLYDLKISFVSVTEETDEKTIRIGFRTIELVQEELEQGLSFYFKVNDVPIFAKGANEIPINVLPEKGQDPDVIRKVLQSAKDAHMNMLRVWGGGVYESDYFYDVADEFGILIWQDLMFACALYPTDEAYLSNVAEEVDHQLRRLASHASIAIWSGNNENEAALVQNWYGSAGNFDAYKQDYVTLYVDTIEPEVLATIPGVTFITSSPTNGLESDQEGHLASNPQDPLYGDVHFYDYSSDSWSVSTFPIPRFASEFGYQSMPSVESWLTATDSLENIHPDSSFLDYRQHHPDGNLQNLNLINLQLQMPDASNENYIQAFVYYSQILQAQSIKTETEHYRSFKGRVDEQGRGNTMGALFWQLNDVWVAPTWSGMDYTGRWKMLHYFAKEFFSPMIVTGRLTNEDLEVYAILDGLTVPDVSVKALVRVYQWNSLNPPVSVEFPVTLDPLTSVLVTTVNAPTALTTAGCGSDYAVARTQCFFVLNLLDQDNNQLVTPNYIFPEKLKNSILVNANVQIASVTAADEEGKMFEIVVTTDAVALFVWLDSHDLRGQFSENGFLQVLPSKTVYFTADDVTTVEDLNAALTVTHLRDPAYL